eukprot:TRINITY_DN28668_c0_g2_i1.p3 TRINITY_DN28668_c0_g2~~TRINITY_DN28668_c0_g2_i1.p3  ORF type:complete len:121 (+),score=18.41 TRINITY_DN28668_c0_g2_i1:148-510(+)
MLRVEGISEVIRLFGVGSLLLPLLHLEEQQEEQALSDDDEEEDDMLTSQSRILREKIDSLIAHLPSFLREDAERRELRDGELVCEADGSRAGMDLQRRVRKRLSLDLPLWIHSGMVSAAE